MVRVLYVAHFTQLNDLSFFSIHQDKAQPMQRGYGLVGFAIQFINVTFTENAFSTFDRPFLTFYRLLSLFTDIACEKQKCHMI